MSIPETSNNGQVPTVLAKDSNGRELLCFLEQIIPIDNSEYALLTPVDTPVSLFRLNDEDDPELIETIEKNEPILEVEEVMLRI